LPLLVVSFTGLVWLIHASRSPWRAAIAGWWFGFAHFLFSIYWIGAAMLTDPSRFGWMVAPAVIGLSAGFALFPALAAFAARLPPLPIAGRVLALAVTWTAAEWLRGNILTGFPMNLMGTVWMPSVGMIQSAAVVGVYGLSFATVLAAAAPAALVSPPEDEHRARRPWLLPAIAFGLLAAIWVGGQARLALAPDRAPTEVNLRLVQANIDQTRKWEDGAREAGLAHHVVLSHEPGLDEVDVVIWPETAVPFFLDESATLQAFVSRAAPLGGYVITGAPRRTRSAGRTIAVWNSLHALGPAEAITASYDKHHLVPFGEYMPLRGIINLRRLAYGAVDSSAGPGARTLRLPGVPPFSPLICYEAIFPGEVVADDAPPGERPQWLLNITNDAWFGHTAGPYQHFQAARLRAVEEGMPLVRAANTGISAVVDSYGRVVGRLGLGEIGVLDAPLPPALAAPTPMARFGDWILAILLLLATAATLAIGIRRWRSTRRPGQGE
ncbi:MAG: apolipoprotein N-acyltransferase, partial [Rhodospirillaceae bacterium]|nr:apolipoprotein N-acyltransferase [Rhodospirillaceae bacterium]